jgi:stearoyl-CoA desaturase (delta-9 desaturase)
MTLNQKIRAIQFINLFLTVLGIVLIALDSAWWMLLMSYFVFVLMCPLGISAGLHRLVTHKSFKTNKIIERILLLFSVYATVGSSIAWVAMHRMHHAFSDSDKDPHTPYDSGKMTFKKLIHTWLGVGESDPMKLPISYVKDLVRDPYHKFIHDNYFKILLIPVAILSLIKIGRAHV